MEVKIGGKDITRAFRVMGENEKGGRLVYLCAKIKLCVSYNYLKRKNANKYIRVARSRDDWELGML